MPLSERFWWIRIVGVVSWALAGFGMLAVGVTILLPGNGTLWALLSLAIGASLLIASWARLDGPRDARSRMLRRRQALQGDVDAIPASRIVPDPASAPDVAARPLLLTLPRHWLDYRFVVLVGYLAWALSLIWIAVVGGNIFSAAGAQLPVVLTAVGIGSTLASGILLRSITGPFGVPRRLTATTDGVLWQPVIGRARFVRWHECRLLEVASTTIDTSWFLYDKPARRYTLYTDRSCIAWIESAPARSKPSGDHAALLSLIFARTGLSPRTFDRALEPGGEFPRGTVIDTVEPIPPPPSASGVYVLAFARSSRRARFVVGALGALFTGAGILATLWTLDTLGAIVALGAVRFATAWINGGIAVILVALGLVGLLMLVAALNPWPRSHPCTIRADPAGLTLDRSHIAWDAVADIARLSIGTTAIYRVMSAADDTTITWPERLVPSTSGAIAGTPVTPAELAAVVSAHSGKPILVMHRLRLL